MKNYQIAKIFNEIADAYEIKGVKWKPRAYRAAAGKIENLTEDVEDLYRRGKLGKVPGLGASLRDKIGEYIEKGRVGRHRELLDEVSRGLIKIMNIPGVGPARTRRIHKRLGVNNISQLKQAARRGRIAELEGFGEKIQREILEGVEQVAASENRFRLDLALKTAEDMADKLRQSGYFRKVAIAGSLRRRRSTIGDIDILARADDPGAAAAFFVKWPDAAKVVRQGKSRSSIRLETGLNVDLRLVEAGSWGSALQYFTGSKEHNIELRKIAADKGYKLNEYGLFKKDRRVAGSTEKAVYKKLGFIYIEPELRENSGELEAAASGKLPVLVKREDIRGDLHVHTDWSDGGASIRKMAEAAKNRGYEYICISDHSASRRIAGGLSAKKLAAQIREIEKTDREVSGIRILSGAEVDILGDGRLDFPDSTLAKLDFVVASIHSGFKMGERKITDRMIRAIKNKHVKAIGHPTGRIINQRSGYRADLKKIIKAAAEHGTALEINASPQRLDLAHAWVREAVKQGAKLAINTDSHSPAALDNMRFGLSQARRGWAEKKDIINTRSISSLIKLFD